MAPLTPVRGSGWTVTAPAVSLVDLLTQSVNDYTDILWLPIRPISQSLYPNQVSHFLAPYTTNLGEIILSDSP